MDERNFEEAQALTERLIHAGIEQALQCHLEPPLEIHGQRICRDCDGPLSADRLKANPAAVCCTECQNDREKERHRGKRN